MNPQRYYFDANALVKFYYQEPGTLEIRRLVADHKPIMVSPVTMLECFGTVMKKHRDGKLRPKHVRAIFDALRRDISDNPETRRNFQAIALSPGLFKRAESLLLLHGKLEFGPIDALHIAVAEKLQADFPVIMATSDKRMKNVCQNLKIQIFDAELTR